MKYTDAEMIAALRNAAASLGTDTLSRPAYSRLKKGPSAPAIETRFRSWRNALAKADLNCTTVKGGQRISCRVCGQAFKGDRSKKSRRTCSTDCSKRLFQESRANLKGDTSTPQAARGRARNRVAVLACGRCGRGVDGGRLEVHHHDRNPYNNTPENLEVLCVRCHKAEHRLAARLCACCEQPFQPRRSSQAFCSHRCAGKATAAATRARRTTDSRGVSEG